MAGLMAEGILAERLMETACHEGCRFCVGKVLLLAGVGMTHKREVYDTLDGLSWYFRGFKKVTQLPWEG